MMISVPLVDGAGEWLTLDGVSIRAFGGRVERVTAETIYGFVTEPTTLRFAVGRVVLEPLSWFVANDEVSLEGGRGLLIVKPGSRGLSQLGGPLEACGRLRYIDGCTDSLLVGPPRRGDPCANHLHIPRGTRQSAHIHPSLRVGVVARGGGVCITERASHRLDAGLGFMIPAGLRHSFHTEEQSLDVWTWHPDSDTGPTDEDHPMVNRTLL